MAKKINMSDTKKCSVCGKTKLLTEFYLQSPGGKPRAGWLACALILASAILITSELTPKAPRQR